MAICLFKFPSEGNTQSNSLVLYFFDFLNVRGLHTYSTSPILIKGINRNRFTSEILSSNILFLITTSSSNAFSQCDNFLVLSNMDLLFFVIPSAVSWFLSCPYPASTSRYSSSGKYLLKPSTAFTQTHLPYKTSTSNSVICLVLY